MTLPTDNYEYIDEDLIDEKLKCIICTQPFQSCVTLDCQHTFCRFCIQTWIEKNASCPICRRYFGTISLFTNMSNSIMDNQLDCLLVRCLRCKKTDMKRIHFSKHWKRCSKTRMAFVSHSIQKRWSSIKRTMWSKSSSSSKTATHQMSRIPTTEVIHHPQLSNLLLQNNEQQLLHSRPSILAQSSSLRSTTLRPHGRNQFRGSGEMTERTRRAIYYISFWIVVSLCMIMFQGVIIYFLQTLAKLILLFLSLYLCCSLWIICLCCYLWKKFRRTG